MKDNFDDIECLNCMDGKYDTWQCPSCGREIVEKPLSSDAVLADVIAELRAESVRIGGGFRVSIVDAEKILSKYFR